MELERDSMVFYKSFLDSVLSIADPGERLNALETILKYGIYGDGEEPEGIAKAIFLLAKPQIDANNKRYIDGCKGAEYGKLGGRPKKVSNNAEENPRGLEEETPMGLSEETPNENENVNENVVRETRARAKTTRFIPPTVEEVAEYCRERGNKVDPQRFVDYYTSNGWQVGKNKMKDWKAAIRSTWERDERTQTAPVNTPRAKPRPSEEWERSGDAYTDLDAMFTSELIARHRGAGNG